MSVSIGELTGEISLEDRFSTALEGVAKLTEGIIEKMEGSFKSVGIAALTAGTAITAMAGTVIYLGTKGSEINDLEGSFNRLAGSIENADNIMSELQKGTAGTIGSLELLQFANKALSSGAIKTADDFGKVSAAARVLSREGFGSVEQEMNVIERAMTTGRVRQLQYMTGVIDLKKAETDYAKSLGTTRDQLTAAGKLHADQTAILETLNKKVQEAGILQTSFAERVKSVNVAIADWFDKVAAAVAASPNLGRAFDAIGNAITRNFGGAGQTALEVIVGWVNKFADAVAQYGPIVIDWVAKIISGIENIWHTVTAAWDLVPDWFKNIARDAALATIAVKLAEGAISGIAGGGGGSNALGTVANVSGIVQGVAALGSIIGGTYGPLKDFIAIIKEMPPVEGGLLGYVKNLGSAIGNVSLMIAGSNFAIFAGGVGLVTTGFLALKDSITETYDAWKSSKSMWDFLRTPLGPQGLTSGMPLGFLSDPIIKRFQAWMKGEAPGALGSKLTAPLSTGTIRGGIPELGAKVDEDQQAQIQETNAKILKANEELTKKSESLWGDYYQNLAKLDGDTHAGRVAALDKWYKAEYESIYKSIGSWTKRSEAIDALNSDMYTKMQLEDKAYADTVNKIAEDARTMEQQNYEKEDQRKQAITDAGVVALSKAYDDYNDAVQKSSLSTTDYQIAQIQRWVDESIRAFKGNEEQALEFKNFIEGPAAIQRLNATGGVGEGTPDHIMNAMSGADFESQHQMIDPGKKAANAWLTGFRSGLKDFPSILIQAFTGGGGVSGAFQALGTNITNKLFGEGGTLSAGVAKFTSSLSNFLGKGLGKTVGDTLGGAIGGLIPVIGGLVGPLIGKLGSLLAGIGGPSAAEKAGRAVAANFEKSFASTTDMINKVGDAFATIGKSREEAQAAIKAFWDAEKQGAEATQEAVNKLNEALKRASEIDAQISNLGIKTHDELMHAADIANAAYEKIAAGVKTGQFTAEDATKAYMAYQEALAAAGDEAAKAWVKAHQGMDDFEKAAADAGYQTQQDLQDAADKARKLAEYMRDSGKYSADAVADAFKKAEDAANKALGISQKLLDRQKTLQDAVSQEAPEAEMGSIEKAQRAELAGIDKQIEDAKKAAGQTVDANDEAAKKIQELYEKYGHEWNQHLDELAQTTATNTSDHFEASAASMHDNFISNAQDAANQIDAIFGQVHITIPIDFDVHKPDLPNDNGRSEAAGEVGFASGPMSFRTQGNEFFAFGGEGQGLSGLTSKLSGGTGGDTYVMQTIVDGKVIKESIFKQLEQTPTSRDKKILQQVVK